VPDERHGDELRAAKTLGYLIPEFPGQTHIFIWREIEQVRRLGHRVHLYSTREPPDRDRARHAFAAEAAERTTYLWPPSTTSLAASAAWALARPSRLLAATRLALTIDVDAKPNWRSVLPLVAPACILGYALIRDRVDHLHVHSCANSALIALLAKRLTGVPYSLVLHGDLHWWGGGLAQKFGEADFTMVITRRLLAEVRSAVPGLREEQLLLGPMGVDTERWKPGARPDAAGPFHVVSVGRLHRVKGHDTAIRSIQRLTGQGRDVVLSIVGEGPERDRLAELAGALGVADHVRLRGSLPEHEIIALLREADAFLLASHSEPLGVAYMEAMALELPTIGTHAGGVPELITDGVDGLLVAPHDEAGVADAVARLMDDPALRVALGKAARDRIVARFDSRAGATALAERIGRASARAAA
jgi:glycosyltransferase involved in cell wall biosynthesis